MLKMVCMKLRDATFLRINFCNKTRGFTLFQGNCSPIPKMDYCIPKGEAGEKSNLALETYFNSMGRQVYKMLTKSKSGP